jgi:hypothetical protein
MVLTAALGSGQLVTCITSESRRPADGFSIGPKAQSPLEHFPNLAESYTAVV